MQSSSSSSDSRKKKKIGERRRPNSDSNKMLVVHTIFPLYFSMCHFIVMAHVTTRYLKRIFISRAHSFDCRCCSQPKHAHSWLQSTFHSMNIKLTKIILKWNAGDSLSRCDFRCSSCPIVVGLFRRFHRFGVYSNWIWNEPFFAHLNISHCISFRLAFSSVLQSHRFSIDAKAKRNESKRNSVVAFDLSFVNLSTHPAARACIIGSYFVSSIHFLWKFYSQEPFSLVFLTLPFLFANAIFIFSLWAFQRVNVCVCALWHKNGKQCDFRWK